MTFDKVKTLGRKSMSDLRKAFTNPKIPLSQLEVTTEPPSHPPIPVQFLPHRNTPPVNHWENPSPTFLFMQEHSISNINTPGTGTGLSTRTYSIHSSTGMSSSASFSGVGMGIGEMRMPVDVNRLSKALTIVTSASMGMIAPDFPGGGGGKKVNRGARLCELGNGSPTMRAGAGRSATDLIDAGGVEWMI
jgi:hypothetical protein